MKIYAINGGPRKKWNTATMLEHFLKGAASVGNHVETETIHLFDLKYTGCISCYACKRGGPGYGKCAVKDDIQALLRDLPLADGVVFGSPIYFHDITAQLRGFLERLVYQYLSFEKGEANLAPKPLPIAMIYTMNVTGESMRQSGYQAVLAHMEQYLGRIFQTAPEQIFAFNTYQYKNYQDYKASYWNEPEKAAWHKNQFPLDCQAAFDAGKRMASQNESGAQAS